MPLPKAPPSLHGQAALVTGGSRGIGRAIARTLAENGAQVIVHHSGRDDRAAVAVIEEIRQAGGRADLVAADLADEAAAVELVAAIRGLGIKQLNIFVSNAADGHVGPFEEQTVADFDRQIAVNLRAPFFTVQQLLPLFADGARIVLSSSIRARRVGAGAAVYAATEVLTRYLAVELGPRAIRVNAIAAGVVETEMARFLLDSSGGPESVLAGQALQRIGQPQDIADIVAFLVSDDARFIDGQVIEANGGADL